MLRVLFRDQAVEGSQDLPGFLLAHAQSQPVDRKAIRRCADSAAKIIENGRDKCQFIECTVRV